MNTFTVAQYQKRKIQGWFQNKTLTELLKTFNRKKSHTNVETKIIPNEKNLELLNIAPKNYHGQIFIIKTIFYNSTYLLINKNCLSRSGKISLNKNLPF